MIIVLPWSSSCRTFSLPSWCSLCGHICCLHSFMFRLMSPLKTVKFHFILFLLFSCLCNYLCFILLTCQNQLAVLQRYVSFCLSSPKQANVITAPPYCICQTLSCCPHSSITLEIHFQSKLPVCFHGLRRGLTFNSTLADLYSDISSINKRPHAELKVTLHPVVHTWSHKGFRLKPWTSKLVGNEFYGPVNLFYLYILWRWENQWCHESKCKRSLQ